MNNKRRLRMVLLGVLCGGLLLVGIGAGICTFELSRFTYGGTVVPKGETSTLTETFQVGKGTTPVWVLSSFLHGRESVDTLAVVQADETVQKGTMRVNVRYQKIPGMEIGIDSWKGEQESGISLHQHTDSKLAMLVSCKDRLLADLQSRELHEYLPIHVESVEITVNPGDEQRLCLDHTP